jgi:hypothetical protein
MNPSPKATNCSTDEDPSKSISTAGMSETSMASARVYHSRIGRQAVGDLVLDEGRLKPQPTSDILIRTR